MSRVLLDTSAYSALRRNHAGVQRALEQAECVVLSPVVLGELLAGFQAGRRYAENRRLLEAFLSEPGVEAVAIEASTADYYAAILQGLRQQGTPIPPNDVWIAATAMQYGLHIVTTDRHFLSIPQVLTDYHEPA
jgi:tRNA(fMet)-specific endonuclease VapC